MTNEGRTFVPWAIAEAAIVYAMRRGIRPGLDLVLSRWSLTLPQLPVVQTAYLGFAVTLLAALWVVISGEKLSSYGLGRPRRWWIAVAAGIAVSLVILAYAVMIEPLLTNALMPVFGPSRATAEFGSVVGNSALFLFVLPFIWLFAALGEEFLYRGFLMGKLARGLGDGRTAWLLAAVIQAMLFGAAHLYQGVTGAVGLIPYGLIYAAAARLPGLGLWPAILAHGLVDTLGFTLLFLGLLE